MSILIKGIDMPKEGEHQRIIIHHNGSITIDKRTYYEDAQAIQIPTPHGRLIDEEKILSPIMCKPKSLRLDDNAQYNIITLIADAPTILEAEE